MWPFSAPKPTPPGVIIRNVLGEQIDHVQGMWDLANADLRSRQWPHADLSGLSLSGANLQGTNLMGARLVRTSFWERTSRVQTFPTRTLRRLTSAERSSLAPACIDRT